MKKEFDLSLLKSEKLRSKLKKKHKTTFEDSFSEEVWLSTYKDHNDKTIDDTIYRLAVAISSVENTKEQRLEWTEKFYDLLSGFKSTAGGRIYSNAGTDWKGTSLLNCFVSPRETKDIDSLKNIFHNLHNQAQTLKSEGGWGENFSYIRPRGSFIHGVGVETPGAVKYMEIFDSSSDIITSGSGKKSLNKTAKGKIRKGAMMAVLDISHPDIIEFITAKQQPGKLTKFNMSVNCTDEFMNKLLAIIEAEKNKEEIKDIDKWDLRFPDTTHSRYKLEWDGNLQHWEGKGYTTVVYQTISVKWLWNLIMESTYNRAEPGILFLDRANYFNPLNYAETIQSTNPCGEQVLAPGGVCDLGSINLTQFINNDNIGFNIRKLKKYVSYMVRFLDNVNEYSKAPLPEYDKSMKNKRRIGIGILGWGSALFMLKIRFGSNRAIELREEVMSTIATTAYETSIDLAEEKGMFSLCNPQKHVINPFIKNLKLSTKYIDKLSNIGIRNSSLLSIQPTGNTSILANVVSGGLEPIFMPEYIRTVIVSNTPEHIIDVTPKWYEGEWCETKMFKFSKEGDEEILRGKDNNGTIYKIDKNRGLTKEVICEDYGVRHLKKNNEWKPKAKWAATTKDLTVDDHVNDLKGFARWVDSAMSKTINIPYDYPFEKFQDIYINTYKSGYVKGVTTYRAGTMTSVLSAKDEKNADILDEEIILDNVKLPDSSPAVVKVIKAEGKKWYLTVILNEQQSRPFALFVHTNSHEKNVTTHDAIDKLINLARTKGIPDVHIEGVLIKVNSDSNASKISRVIGLCLRHGILIKNIVSTLDKIDDVFVGSFLFQIKKFLGSYIKDGEKSEGDKCESCESENIIYSEGCKKCSNCGSSKCG